MNIIYSSAIDYDYDRMESPDHYERCAGDYCRCTTLENFVISKINIDRLVEFLKSNLEINHNLFDKDIVKICEGLDKEDFIFETSGGYYGEELDSVRIDNGKIVNSLASLFSIKGYRKEKLKKIISNTNNNYISDDYVKKILIEEYGYILESLKNSKFKIIDVNTNDIIFPQKEYNIFIKSKNLSGYKNRKGICGLVKMVDDKYHVIDGYHRINSNINRNFIKVILAYE